MSTTIPFMPSTTSAFTFQPVINGTQYTAVVTWNIFEQRYYLNLYSTAGALVICTAVVSSGPQLGVTLTWSSQGGGLATAVTNAPHNVPVGQVANVYISQTGTDFDGAWQVLATGPSTFTYALANPDENQPLTGQLSFNVNLVALLGAGWLIYRYASGLFEWQ